MSSEKQAGSEPEMREECDFSKGVRGKYAGRFAEGRNVIVLDPDVAEVFGDGKAVNEALRVLARSRDSQRASQPGVLLFGRPRSRGDSPSTTRIVHAGEAHSHKGFAADRVGARGSGALAWRLALRLGIVALQQKPNSLDGRPGLDTD